MGQFRCYIKPFDDAGNYVADYLEVTEDVNADSLTNLNQKLDNNEYDVGLFNFNNLSVKLDNQDGKYSNVDVFQSIFRYKRANSLFKLTWAINPYPTQCGTAVCGKAKINPEVEIFEGLLNDDTASARIDDHKINFTVLGKESIFEKAIVPFGSLSVGDLLSEAIYIVLNQTEVTNILTVDSGNISTGVDVQIDSIAGLQNKTVKEALDNLLEESNSVLYINNNIVYVKNRDVSATLAYTFYGQASNVGIENIKDIVKMRSGANRIFNFWTWKDTALLATDSLSVLKYDYRKKEVEFDAITNSGKQQSILNSLRDEFSNPKQEFELITPINYQVLELFLFDKINIDYPTVIHSADGNPVPIWGAVKWGEFKWGYGDWAVRFRLTEFFKIMGRTIDMKNGLLRFKLRAV
jgi:hypothetical protein